MQPRRALPRLVPTQPAHAAIHGEAQKRRAARLEARARRGEEGRARQARMRLPPVTHREGGTTLAPALEVLWRYKRKIDGKCRGNKLEEY